MKDTSNLISDEKDLAIPDSIIIDDRRDEFGNYDAFKHMPSSNSITSTLLESLKSGLSDCFLSIGDSMRNYISLSLSNIDSNAVLEEIKRNLHDSLVKPIVEGISDLFVDFEEIIQEIRIAENLTEEEFEEKYSDIIKECKHLGKNGWVVSQYTNPEIISYWYNSLDSGTDDILSFFDEDNGRRTIKILDYLKEIYSGTAFESYFDNGIHAFYNSEYMTCAFYFVALIDVRVNMLVDFSSKKSSKKLRNSEKYCDKGFQSFMSTDFQGTKSVISKSYKFLYMYPSIISFLRRLFVDGKYPFEKGIEPPYVNRNWLLHGRSTRNVERYECLQLFNALSACEYLFGRVYKKRILFEC